MHWRLIFQVLATFFSGSIIGYSDLYRLNPATAGTSGINKNDYSLRIKSKILYTTNQNL
jgi:hypothetical protein